MTDTTETDFKKVFSVLGIDLGMFEVNGMYLANFSRTGKDLV